MTKFGDFSPLCTNTPSYPWCNLFYRQLLTHSPSSLSGLSQNATSAPVGINPKCGIPLVGSIISPDIDPFVGQNPSKSLGNIAQIVCCALSILIIASLIFFTGRRKAAVGRVELRSFLVFYLLTLPFNLITTGAVLEQGSKSLVIVTAVHAGLVAALFATLLGNALVATQVVEDGTMASIIPFHVFALAVFAATMYISLDVGLSITSTIGPFNPITALNSIPLFVFTSIWPGICAILYLVIMTYIVLGVLNELRPMLFYILSAILFVLSQLAWFLLGRVICQGANSKIDGSFIATILETASVVVLYVAWKSITEESWDEDAYYPS